MIVILNYLQKNERMNKRLEISESLIQKHEPEIPQIQLINSSKNPNHERSKNINKKTDVPIKVTSIMIIHITV